MALPVSAVGSVFGASRMLPLLLQLALLTPLVWLVARERVVPEEREECASLSSLSPLLLLLVWRSLPEAAEDAKDGLSAPEAAACVCVVAAAARGEDASC